MIAGLSLGSDNKRYFRGKLPRLAIGTIILMPLLYGAMYLWAFWNPFAKVNEIPAAIVNLDHGAEMKGKPVHAGDEVTKSLLESDQLDLTEMSTEEAAAKLGNGSINFVITLPENFSEAIVSAEGNQAKKAELTFTFNDSNSYLATIIGEEAAQEVINKINRTIGGKAVDQVLVSVQDSGAELEKAVAGAGELANGLGKAKKGSGKLASGSKQLAGGIGKAREGSVKLAAGTGELQSKLDGMITPALRGLGSNQLKNLNGRASELARQVEAVAPVVVAIENSPLAAATNQAVDALQASEDPAARAVGDQLAQANADFRKQAKEVQNQLDKVTVGLDQLEQQLKVGDSGNLQQQLGEIDDAIATEVKKLREGLHKLNSGAEELSTGMAKLQTGSGKLVKGTNELNAGNKKLLKGANELHAGLQEGLEAVPGWSDQQRNDAADVLSTPVSLTQDTEDEAATFGTGFAPFFCSLALFVGGILVWMLLTPLQSRPVVSGLNMYRTAIASYVPALLTGALQATVLFLVITLGLGLSPDHAVGMWLFMILMSAAFLAMIQAFNAIFDTAIGRVVTLAFLMVQLISAGGIYPVPTTALPFQVIHPFDPMTYSVNGLRELTVAGTVDSHLWIAIAVLAGIVLLGVTATALSARRNRQYTMERLYPSIEV